MKTIPTGSARDEVAPTTDRPAIGMILSSDVGSMADLKRASGLTIDPALRDDLARGSRRRLTGFWTYSNGSGDGGRSKRREIAVKYRR